MYCSQALNLAMLPPLNQLCSFSNNEVICVDSRGVENAVCIQGFPKKTDNVMQ